MSLDHDVVPAAGESAGAVVLMHGRGADRHDLHALAAALPREWTYVLPDAPFPAAPWGYGPGFAWYRYLGEDRPEPESFTTSLDALGGLLAALPGQLGGPPARVVLGGFSQGGTLALGYALARPGGCDAVLNLSGFLADHPQVLVPGDGSAAPPVFWGHGTHDPSIPFALAERGRARLRAAGVPLTARDYGIGHWIDDAELADAAAFLKTLRES